MDDASGRKKREDDGRANLVAAKVLFIYLGPLGQKWNLQAIRSPAEKEVQFEALFILLQEGNKSLSSQKSVQSYSIYCVILKKSTHPGRHSQKKRKTEINKEHTYNANVQICRIKSIMASSRFGCPKFGMAIFGGKPIRLQISVISTSVQSYPINSPRKTERNQEHTYNANLQICLE
jgi:hypothetical protein